jgi:Flp pilus assembly protein TadB
MEKTVSLILAFITLVAIMPLASAIYMGEATSEPTIITLTIVEPEETIEEEEEYEHKNPQRQRALEDQEYESTLREVKFGEWSCINNQIQRTITSFNHVEYEVGSKCGFEDQINSQETNNFNKLFLTISILLGVFIVLALLLIISILIYQRN